MFSLSQRHKAALSNIYQKAVPDHCAEGGSFSKKRSLKMIPKHLYSSTLDLAFFLSGLALEKETEKEKTLTLAPNSIQWLYGPV